MTVSNEDLPMNMMNQYTAMAHVYDAWMQHDPPPYDEWVEFIDAQVRAPRIPGTRILDVGCGTGQISIRLQQRGWDMVGIDASADMIDIAKRRFGERAPFYHMPLPSDELATLGKFAAAISCFDVVNYLARPGQLRDVFQQVGDCLLPGGKFIFDTNSRYKLEDLFGQYHSGDDFEEFAYVWRNNYSAADRACAIDVTFFVRDSDGRYQRFTERHQERWFTQGEVTEALAAGSMRLTKVCANYSDAPLEEQTIRITWVAERLSPIAADSGSSQ